MDLIDFKRGSKYAFVHGFLKGLAAPMMLRHVETVEPVKARVISVSGPATVEEALARGWKRVGEYVHIAIERYEEETRRSNQKK